MTGLFTKYGWAIFNLISIALATDRILHPRDNSKLYFAIEIDSDALSGPNEQLRQYHSGWTYEHPLDSVPNHHLFSIPMERENELIDFGPHIPKHLQKRSQFRTDLESGGVQSLEILRPRQLHKRLPVPFERPGKPSSEKLDNVIETLDIRDPIFGEQWHLLNTVEQGHDINVTGVWMQNVTGAGVRVAVIDDGLDMDTEDLKDNFFPDGSWDFNDPGPFPKPRLADDRHGTRCAGEIGAGRNEACGVGVAYDSKVAGIRILSKRIMPGDEALAINFAMDKNDIYSCSWGPSDDGQTMEGPPEVVKKAMLNAINNGRENKGNVYVFASGNGGNFQDNCNFDGYTNSIYSVTVASIDRKGLHPGYSEACSANMVVTYSSGSGDFIHTTDVNGACTSSHGGTSAAAPIAAGIFALVLSVRPDLTWRDIQYLAWNSAVPFDTKTPGWQLSGSKRYFHHEFGFGKLDASNIIEHARNWESVKPQAWYHGAIQHVNKELPSNGQGVDFTFKVTQDDLDKANFDKVEHVNVLVNAEAARRGDLSMQLVSPSGMISEIMPMRYMDSATSGVRNWKFMSVAHWGEDAVGDWRLVVRNADGTNQGSVLSDWQLQLWGASKDADKAMIFPGTGKNFMHENGASDGNKDNWDSNTGKPIDHTEKPNTQSESKSKPEPTTSISDESSSSTSEPTPTQDSEKETPSEAQPTESQAASSTGEEEENKDHSDSLIPTFGMTKHTAAWIYGSVLVIILFISGILIYISMARRRRGNGGKSYAFNPLLGRSNDDDEDGDELDYLNEFSLTDEEDEEEEHEEDDYANESHSPSEHLAAGKKARDLYSNTQGAKVTTIPKAGSESSTEEGLEKKPPVEGSSEDPFAIDEEESEPQPLIKN